MKKLKLKTYNLGSFFFNNKFKFYFYLRQNLESIRNETVLRRKYLIYGLNSIFFLKPQPKNIFKIRCDCKNFYTIRGLHLPQTKARLGL